MTRFEELHAEWLKKEAKYQAEWKAEFGRTRFQRGYGYYRRLGFNPMTSLLRAVFEYKENGSHD